MLNYIWCGMIILAYGVGLFTGNVEEVTKGAMEGADSAVTTCIGLLGSMCLWTGLSKVAEDSGLTEVFARVLKPITKIIFPRIRAGSAPHRAIVMNMVANLLGMGNAATPLGIKAMHELDKLNHHRGAASREMCMFVVVNTASIQLIPATIISLARANGAASPTDIIVPVWICSICALTVGVTAAKFFEKRGQRL